MFRQLIKFFINNQLSVVLRLNLIKKNTINAFYKKFFPRKFKMFHLILDKMNIYFSRTVTHIPNSCKFHYNIFEFWKFPVSASPLYASLGVIPLVKAAAPAILKRSPIMNGMKPNKSRFQIPGVEPVVF